MPGALGQPKDMLVLFLWHVAASGLCPTSGIRCGNQTTVVGEKKREKKSTRRPLIVPSSDGSWYGMVCRFVVYLAVSVCTCLIIYHGSVAVSWPRYRQPFVCKDA